MKISTDAVIGISQAALNKGLSKMMSDGIVADIELSGEDWHLKKAKLGTPAVRFLPNEQSRVRLMLPFVSGVLVKKTVDFETDTVKKKEYKLGGKSVSFETDLNRLNVEHFHDVNFTAQAIYLDLTEISNIDAFSLELDTADLAMMQDVMRGMVSEMQKAVDNRQLLISRIQVPKVPDTVGPLAPTAAAMAASCAPEHPEIGELDFLLMTRGEPLPTAADEHAQNGFVTPFVATESGKGHDAVLVLSDRVLLSAIAQPILEKAFPGIELVLDPAPLPARLHQKGDLKLERRGMFVHGAEAVLKDDRIKIDLILETREHLQSDDGPDGVDFSIVEVVIKKSLTFDLVLKVDEAGLLTFDLKTGAHNDDAPKPEFKGNFEVHGIKDVVKWLGAPLAVFAGPAAGPILAGFTAIITGIAQAIQAGIVDSIDIKERARVGLGPLDGVDTQIQLPGDPVFVFSQVAAGDGNILVGADFLDPPALDTGEIAPFAIQPFPRVEAGAPMPPADTAPELVGEVTLHYRHVDDSRFYNANRRRMPYYILRREQFWHRNSSVEYPAQSESKVTQQKIKRVQSTHTEDMTNTIRMNVSVEGTLEMLDVFSPEIKFEVEKELQVQVTDEVETEQTEDITREFTLSAREQPFGISVWVLMDRYTLMRNDSDRSVVGRWDYANVNYIHLDDYSLAQGEMD
ncbi:hypothetical protein R5H32_20760 [Defluviimonas sp. D31]|uniref:hypothetical protein n=1 Tax=Defluviimonas sp. D31 TaxID=3083253 RepID=UPI00296F8898|nr:hypothetical protein [Defluviimonas sp. D31]MDW4551755.1 hypothetical protein [Defluviimonas sp. D31]